MKAFRTPDETIGVLDATAAASLLTSASDLALVMDRDGVILDTAVQSADLSLDLEGYGLWIGRAWSELVAPESAPKVETLLTEARKSGPTPWRQVTHLTIAGREIPILYRVVALKERAHLVAIGRDLRSVVALQQRLVDAQMSMERDYAKLRSAEARYRLLFQSSSEAVMILDAANHRVLEANPAAAALLEGIGKGGAVGRAFADIFAAAGRPRIQGFLGDLRAQQRPDDVTVPLTSGHEVAVNATLLRQDSNTLLLVRLRPRGELPPPQMGSDAPFATFADASPDAFVLTDPAGRILAANPAFAEMAQVGGTQDARGNLITRWFGRSEVDFDVVRANLRSHGVVRLFATSLRGEQGDVREIEASAAAVGDGRTFGFVIRDIGRRLATSARRPQELPHSAEQLTELIGRVPLKDLVRETTDVIEKLCIETALDLTGDNRASAAEMLGLSRQSLYVKLRRFGFADASGDAEP